LRQRVARLASSASSDLSLCADLQAYSSKLRLTDTQHCVCDRVFDLSPRVAGPEHIAKRTLNEATGKNHAEKPLCVFATGAVSVSEGRRTPQRIERKSAVWRNKFNSTEIGGVGGNGSGVERLSKFACNLN